MAGHSRYTFWDPWLILAQMATLQCAFYVSLGLWIFALDVIVGYPREVEQLFLYQKLLVGTAEGKLLIAAFFFNALTWYALFIPEIR